MASAIRSTFVSCLSTKRHFSRLVNHPEGGYKIVRALDPIFDTLEVVVKASDASYETLATLEYGRISAKIVRDILGVIYIFTGVIPALFYAAKLLCSLAKGLHTGEDVQLHPFKKAPQLAYNEIAKGKLEKILCLGAVSAKCIKGGSATYAFVSTPFTPRETHQTIMLLKHISGFVGITLEMGYRYAAFNRSLDEEAPSAQIDREFKEKMLELSVGMLEKGLQIIYDLAKMFHRALPAKFRLSLTLSIAGLGLYKVWLKTA